MDVKKIIPNSAKQLKDYLFYLGLLFYAVGLPVSKTLLTIGGIVLMVHFFLDRELIRKFKRLALNPLVWPFVGFYMLHFAGMLYTQDMSYALTDLRVKLPILFLPVFLSEAPAFERRFRSSVLLFFMASLLVAVVVASVFSFASGIDDPRQIIRFNNHIRFSILLAYGIFVFGWILMNIKMKNWMQWMGWSIMTVLIAFLFFKAAISGRIIFVTGMILFFVVRLFQKKTSRWIWIPVASIVIAGIVILRLGLLSADDYLDDKETVRFRDLPQKTADGNLYTHSKENKTRINGYAMGYYLSEQELRDNWGDYSSSDLDHHFKNGTSRYQVLVRYLTSCGYPRDRSGLELLTEEDVEKIERGIENVKLSNSNGLKARWYGMLWGYQNYRLYGYSKGSSIMQRVELWEMSLVTIRDNFLFGVGTGDSVQAFKKLKKERNSSLDGIPLRAHNQFLALMVALGIPGILLFIWMIVFPPSFIRIWQNSNFLFFFIIFILSTLTENTLETQVGATFFAFFSSYFVFFNPAPLKFNV